MKYVLSSSELSGLAVAHLRGRYPELETNKPCAVNCTYRIDVGLVELSVEFVFRDGAKAGA